MKCNRRGKEGGATCSDQGLERPKGEGKGMHGSTGHGGGLLKSSSGKIVRFQTSICDLSVWGLLFSFHHADLRWSGLTASAHASLSPPGIC